MLGPQRRWMRLIRLVVACLAFALARPAPCAAVTIDTVVVVSSGLSAAERATAEAKADVPRPSPEAISTPEPRRLESLQSPRALLARKYLRHCSLLC